MSLKVRTTDDGSTTLYNTELDENYHSVFGAIQEAKHVYIEAGFKRLSLEQSCILEIGFGTGLNALLTCEAASSQKKQISYHSIEKYPLEEKISNSLNFGEERKTLLQTLHSVAWGRAVPVTPYFEIHKIQADLLSFDFSAEYDLIYYDAFAPNKQAEMWTPEILKKVSETLSPQGILTTYSTKGTVKQAFRAAGLQVKRLPGPPGKRDMLICTRV